MSSDEQKLSESLRERVAALYEPEQTRLGSDAQRRVIERVAFEARRRQRLRRWQRSGGGAALLLSAAALLWLIVRPREPVLKTQRSEPTTLPGCGLPHVDSASAFQPSADGRRELALGRFGILIASASAELSIEHAEACELALRLERGTLAGDLHSLRPGRLTIRTALGEIVVTGTRFSVRADTDLEVLLGSGVVEVVFADRSSLRMQPGTRLHKRGAARKVEPSPLTAADLAQLSSLFGSGPSAAVVETALAPAKHPAASSGSAATAESPLDKPAGAVAHDANAALLAAAESARRAGNFVEARANYRAASQGRSDGAEVALLRWARFELDSADPDAALRVLALHQRRFARARLGAEAGWLSVQAWQALGKPERAREAARQLLARYADTPQAAGARNLLDAR